MSPRKAQPRIPLPPRPPTALTVQREAEAAWKAHKLHCSRCSGGRIARAVCAEGFALEVDLKDAARAVEADRERKRLAAMAQMPLFGNEELGIET